MNNYRTQSKQIPPEWGTISRYDMLISIPWIVLGITTTSFSLYIGESLFGNIFVDIIAILILSVLLYIPVIFYAQFHLSKLDLGTVPFQSLSSPTFDLHLLLFSLIFLASFYVGERAFFLMQVIFYSASLFRFSLTYSASRQRFDWEGDDRGFHRVTIVYPTLLRSLRRSFDLYCDENGNLAIMMRLLRREGGLTRTSIVLEPMKEVGTFKAELFVLYLLTSSCSQAILFEANLSFQALQEMIKSLFGSSPWCRVAQIPFQTVDRSMGVINVGETEKIQKFLPLLT